MGCLYNLETLFYNDPPTTEIYTLSLHDALPISQLSQELRFLSVTLVPLFARNLAGATADALGDVDERRYHQVDRKSTRLNSSHLGISYAGFCLKKNKECGRQNRPENKKLAPG